MVNILANGVVTSNVPGIEFTGGRVMLRFTLQPTRIAGDQVVFELFQSATYIIHASMPKPPEDDVSLSVLAGDMTEKVKASAPAFAGLTRSHTGQLAEYSMGKFSYRDTFVEDNAHFRAILAGMFGPKLSAKSIASIQAAVQQAQQKYHTARDAVAQLMANPIIADDPTKLVHPLKNDALAALAENNPEMPIVRQRDVEEARTIANKRWESLVAVVANFGTVVIELPLHHVLQTMSSASSIMESMNTYNIPNIVREDLRRLEKNLFTQ